MNASFLARRIPTRPAVAAPSSGTIVMGFAVAAMTSLLALSAPVALAASSATSSALDSLSTSVGTSSDAISGSSKSVSGGKDKVAAGPYRVTRVAELGPRGERRGVSLEPVLNAQSSASEGASVVSAGAPVVQPEAWELRVPAQVAQASNLVPGAVLTVRTQPYGISLSLEGQAQPFYLIVHDEWARALQVQAVDAATGAAVRR